MTTAELQQTPEWLAIHARDLVYRVWITTAPSISNGRNREYIYRVPSEQTMQSIAADISRTPHTIVMYEQIAI